MAYLGTQPDDVKENRGLYNPSQILELSLSGSWGGSLQHISTTTFSSVSEIDITSGFQGYDVFLAQVQNLTGSTNMNFGMQFFESGVLETSNVYHEARQYIQVDSGNGEERSTSSSRLVLNSFQSTDSCSLYIYFYNFTDSTKHSSFNFKNAPSYTADYEYKFGGGMLNQASVVDGVRFSTNTGTMSGTIELYGVKQI